MNNMAMVNVNNLLNIKDSRWLQLEVCREFQRNKCSRPDTECKFAHPPANVEVQNGRVTACYDSIKGRCNREKPPCKYFHPPLHLKDQLLINGRNHLALKNALMQQMGLAPGQPVVPGQVPSVATNPYLGVTSQAYNPYFAAGPLVPLVSDPTGGGVVSPLGVPQQTVVAQQKVPRADRLETYPGMVAYKRPAGDKSGVPVYQPANTSSAAAYQHLMQLQQPFVPVSSNSIQHNSGGSANVPGLPSSSAQDPSNSGLSNGSLDPHSLNNDTPIKRQLKQEDDNDLHDGNNLAGNSGNDLDDETKESAMKRMRVNAGTNSQASMNSNVAVSSTAALAQNNAAYVAAAQSYHNALAAINYTGVALQTNKTQQSANQQNVGQQHGYQGAPSYQSQAHAAGVQQQQNQQQQLLSQYQAMAAAALANQGAFQTQMGVPQPGVAQQQQQNLNMNMNAAQAAVGLNPFAAAAMNPLLAASLPQIAAAQRAGMLANQQGAQGMNPNQFNPNALAAAGMSNAGGGNQAGGFNPFGVQFGGPGGAGNAGLPFQQNQQALLAAYGQFGRGHVPVAVSAANTMASQQLAFVGNPAAAVAAAAAAAAAGGGGVQPGMKRMRPN